MEAFQEFMSAGTVKEIFAAFHKVQESMPSSTRTSLLTDLQPILPYKLAKVVQTIQQAIDKNKLFRISDESKPKRVVVSGAGPCGLRAAISAKMLGFDVSVVEKRTEFTRVNILTLWESTCGDLIALGLKFFCPHVPTLGSPLYIGTKELQMMLLKVCLLVGVDVYYGFGTEKLVLPPSEDCKDSAGGESTGWKIVIRSGDLQAKKKALEADSTLESTSKVEEAKSSVLGFKPNKQGDYRVTYRCNMVDTPEVDPSFFIESIASVSSSTESEEQKVLEFDDLIVAEGEWSKTLRSLGFAKTIDRFSQAIGIVVNLQYNKEISAEKTLRSFLQTRWDPTWKTGPLGLMADAGIVCENVEYLKGTTHYVVVTISKASLLEKGVLIEDKPSSAELLRSENLRIENLFALARQVSDLCGVPSSCEFCEHNPVQVFDFSTRARCRYPFKTLSSKEPLHVEEGILGKGPLVLPVGDALLEPFWPQGLGTNRGFHGVFDAVWMILCRAKSGLEVAAAERTFFFDVMHSHAFTKAVVNPFDKWSVDPATRYAFAPIDSMKRLYKDTGKEDLVPRRIFEK